MNETVAAVSDMLAPEQLEVQTAEEECYHGRLRNYDLIFLGFRATVAFSDKAVTGTTQVLPTGTPRVTRAVRRALPAAAAELSAAAHADTAAKRMQRPPASENRKQRSCSQLRAC
jgi:hypothetical protein